MTEGTRHRSSGKKRNKRRDGEESDKPGRESDGDRVNGSGREGEGIGSRGKADGVEKFNCAYFRSDVSQILRHRRPLSAFLSGLFSSSFSRRARPRKTGMTLRDPLLSPPSPNRYLTPAPTLSLSLSPFLSHFDCRGVPRASLCRRTEKSSRRRVLVKLNACIVYIRTPR